MNRKRWATTWNNMFAHERAEIVKKMGVTSETGLILFCNKKYSELHPSFQIGLKHLMF